MAFLTYSYRLRPTRAQHAQLAEILESQRLLYNAALQERRDAWRSGVSIGFNDQTKSLTEIRGFDPDYGGVPYNLSKWTLKRLDDAMKGFFKRANKKAGKAGFPRFRPISRWSSFGFHQKDGLRLKEGKLRFSGGLVGGLHLKMHREIPEGAEIKSAVFSRENGIWRVALTVDVPVEEKGLCEVIGVDVGIEHLATTSDGLHFPNAREGDRHAKALRRAQRALARARTGSARRRKTKAHLERLQRSLKNARKSHLHEVSRRTVEISSFVALEDLSTKNMTRSARGTAAAPGSNVRQKAGLNRALLDAAPARLISMISYKAESAGGRAIKVDPKHTSQICPACGSRVPKALSERRHLCACGADMHRDHAAAVNIRARGIDLLAHEAARRLEGPNVTGCGVRASGNTDPQISA